MKVAITGHTRGIGKSIFEELTKRSYHVSGYSKSTGWDISLLETRNKILKEVFEFDVFINNAYCPLGQFELLKGLTDSWEGSKKLIVNVGSKSIYANTVPSYMESYVKDKQEQSDYIIKRRLKARPHILNLTLGLVDTEMSSMLLAEKLAPTNVAKLVVDLIELKNQIYVQELMLDVPFQDWNNICSVSQ